MFKIMIVFAVVDPDAEKQAFGRLKLCKKAISEMLIKIYCTMKEYSATTTKIAFLMEKGELNF